jgi:hypothetical protein
MYRASVAPSVPGKGAEDVTRAGEVADDHLGAGRAQGVGPPVLTADQGANRQVAFSQGLDHGAAHAADAARGARDENRMGSGPGDALP